MDTVNLNGFNLNLAGAHQIDLISLIGGTGGFGQLPTPTRRPITMAGPNNNNVSGLTDVQGGTLCPSEATVASPAWLCRVI